MKMDKAQTSPPVEYVFVAGRVPKLSLLELKAVFDFENLRVLNLTSSLIVVKANALVGSEQFKRLGSLRKAGQIIATFDRADELDLGILEKALGDLRVLGISSLTKGFSALRLGKAVKKAGLVRRFVVASHGDLLTDAQSKGLKKGLEVLIFEDEGKFKLATIEHSQDIDAFRHRDRDLPVADPIRGMLPTKLARAMVNLAQPRPNLKILDPFCGVGRVLIEAIDLGYEVVGSDIDPVAVEATKKNLSWFKADSYQIVETEIANLDRLDLSQVGAIVTESFIGQPQQARVSKHDQGLIFAQVAPLYLDLFKQAEQISTLQSLVVVFPEINNSSLLDILIDKLPKNRYDLVDSVSVSRPRQFIGRCIGIFAKID
ncbi:hypothetical protein KC644_02215 [Candidatus Berkelbacteria bacterium]|nr:hypothetical protein [Candidatus Berkelbacteria bacterium]